MKLSQIKYYDVLFSTQDMLTEIVFEKDKQEVLNKCDVGIVLGNEQLYKNRADKGIELYERGLVDKLAVTGGVGIFNKDRKIPEAIKMYEYLLMKGIPESDIFVESESINTRENMVNVLKILDSRYPKIDVKNLRYAVVTSDFHLRRSLGLLSNILGNDKDIEGSKVMDGVTDIYSWSDSSVGRKTIKQEALMLLYLAKHNKILCNTDLNLDNQVKRRFR